MQNTHLQSLKPVDSFFFLLCAHTCLQRWSNLRPKTGDNGLCQTTFPIKIRDENRFQARFRCKDRHATGAETCLLIQGPWFAKPLLFTWWAARRGVFICRPPTGTGGVPMPCQCVGRPQGMCRHGLQPGSLDVGTCAMRKVRGKDIVAWVLHTNQSPRCLL